MVPSGEAILLGLPQRKCAVGNARRGADQRAARASRARPGRGSELGKRSRGAPARSAGPWLWVLDASLSRHSLCERSRHGSGGPGVSDDLGARTYATSKRVRQRPSLCLTGSARAPVRTTSAGAATCAPCPDRRAAAGGASEGQTGPRRCAGCGLPTDERTPASLGCCRFCGRPTCSWACSTAHEAACLFCLNRGHPAHECPEANVDLIKKAKHDITYGESRDAALYRALFLAARR